MWSARKADPHFRELDPRRIVDTVEALSRRVNERFPGSSLGGLIGELLRVSNQTVERMAWIQRPHYPLRITTWLVVAGMLVVLEKLLLNFNQFTVTDFSGFITLLEAALSSIVFIGAAIVFLVSWERRIKRDRALQAIHELRAMAHILDMHQLTKDPERYLVKGFDTASSPKRAMTPFELNRYLDYCSEALALLSKVAALYVQGFQDEVVLEAVDDVEDLTASFSRKIWQKLIILENLKQTIEER